MALALRGLVKRFDAKIAVAGLDLDVPAGSFFGLLGPNGAGKTTTLSMAVGLLRPDAGAAYVLGHDVWADPVEAKRRLGVLPDGVRMFDRLSGAELLAYTGLLRGMDPAEVDRRARDLLDVLGLTDAGRTLVVDYSAGMKKKIGLACALLHAPRLLVLDEPFEAVDPVSAALIRDILHRYVHSGGTVIFSSHVMEVVEKLCSPRGDPGRRGDQGGRHAGAGAGRSRPRGRLRRGGRRPDRHRPGAVVAVATAPGRRSAPAPAAADVRDFVRLKLRLMRNGFRGQAWRVVAFVLGLLFGGWMAAAGRARAGRDRRRATGRRVRGGHVRRRGDRCSAGPWSRCCSSASTRPSTRPGSRCCRCRRVTLARGMLAAAFVGVPALVTLLALSGLIVAAVIRFGWVGRALAPRSAWSVGLVLGVVASRALTSAFAACCGHGGSGTWPPCIIAVLASSVGADPVGRHRRRSSRASLEPGAAGRRRRSPGRRSGRRTCCPSTWPTVAG